jgi:peptidoglycan-associated lipoprotein
MLTTEINTNGSGVKLLAMAAMVAFLGACASGKSSYSTVETPQPVATPTPVIEAEVIAGPEAGSQEHLNAVAGDRVFFAYDSSELSVSARSSLQAQAKWLSSNSGSSVIIQGHADERGTREYNLALGERRAAAAKNYLVALGVSPSRISVISYGKERPVALGSNASSWAKNRRAVMVVS